MKDYKVSVLTVVSDKDEKNIMDESSLKLVNTIEDKGLKMVSYNVIPHKRDILKEKLLELCDLSVADLVLVTVDKNANRKYVVNEVTRSVIDKENTLIDEKIRQYVLLNTAGKVSLDGVSGMRKSTMIINVPENIKGSLGLVLDSGINELERELAE